jgi:membrane-associated phospholipid phosphatase
VARQTRKFWRAFLSIMLLATLVEVCACLYNNVATCKAVSLLGGEAFYIGVGVLIYTLVSASFGLRLIASLLVTAALIALLKVALNLPRPPSSLWLVHASGPGFPSGHAAMSAAFWLLVSLYTRSPTIIGIGIFHSFAVAYSRLV